MSKNNIHKDDLDDLIEIASLLQEKETQDTHISLEEVESVAAELDISPEKVREALHFLKNKRAKEKQEQEEKQRANQQRIRWMASISIAMIVCIGMGLLALAMSANSAGDKLQMVANEKKALAQQAEAQLKNAIDRQAQLTPQLLAMMGGQIDSLGDLQQLVLQEDDLKTKITLSNRLGIEMAKTIGTLPPSKTAADSTAMLQYQYEVTGAQNRISTEKKRYDESQQERLVSLQEWIDGSSGLGPSLALMLGWIEQPSE